MPDIINTDDDLVKLIDNQDKKHSFVKINRDTTWKMLNSISDEDEKKTAIFDWQNEGFVASSKNPAVWNATFESFQEVWLEEVKKGGVDVQPPYKIELVFNFIGQGLDTGDAKLYETKLYVVPLNDDVSLGNLSDFANKVEAMTIEKTKHLSYSDLL